MTDLNERDLQDAWNAEYASARTRRRLPRLRSRGSRTKTVLVAAALIGVVGAPAAIGATGDALREGQRNGTTTRETSIISRVAGTTGNTGGFATRQSNLSTTGGGAVYGCRANTSSRAEPCLRGNNLSTGLAFSFSAQRGNVVGSIRAAGGGDSKKPFTTNATGVADGLNAERVGSKTAAQITQEAAAAGANAGKSRWALINAAGQIEAQSGGFSVTAGYPDAPAAANGNVYINTGSDVSGKGVSATIALQNGTDQNGDGIQNGRAPGPDANPEFSGEISASRCAIAGVVTCAPTGTNDANHIVVSPRNSDGTVTAAGQRKRFYVTITG